MLKSLVASWISYGILFMAVHHGLPMAHGFCIERESDLVIELLGGHVLHSSLNCDSSLPFCHSRSLVFSLIYSHECTDDHWLWAQSTIK